MGFDLVTFLAQIVNLAILIWVLKHFLYGPVLTIMKKRQQKIAEDVRMAEEKLTTAQQMQEQLSTQLANFEHHKQQRFNALEAELQDFKASQLYKMEQQFHERQRKMQDDLDRSWHNAKQTVRDMVGAQFVNLSKTILAEWTDKAPMDQVLVLFQKKLSTLTKKQSAELNAALIQKSIIVTTSEPLNKGQRQFVNDLLSDLFDIPTKTKIQFKTDASFILGLEMRVGQYVVDWNVKTYLDTLQQNLTQDISGIITSEKRKGE